MITQSLPSNGCSSGSLSLAAKPHVTIWTNSDVTEIKDSTPSTNAGSLHFTASKPTYLGSIFVLMSITLQPICNRDLGVQYGGYPKCFRANILLHFFPASPNHTSTPLITFTIYSYFTIRTLAVYRHESRRPSLRNGPNGSRTSFYMGYFSGHFIFMLFLQSKNPRSKSLKTNQSSVILYIQFMRKLRAD